MILIILVLPYNTTYVYILLQCPVQLSRVSEVGFFPLPMVFFPQVAGKIFFFPPYDSYHRSSTERRSRELTIICPPPPTPPDPTPSPTAAHRPEPKPFMQSLPHNPIDLPPPRRRLTPIATDATASDSTTSPSTPCHHPHYHHSRSQTHLCLRSKVLDAKLILAAAADDDDEVYHRRKRMNFTQPL